MLWRNRHRYEPSNGKTDGKLFRWLYNRDEGAIAQLAERIFCKDEAAGSNPAGSTDGSRLKSGSR
jgi:hypothetical protein